MWWVLFIAAPFAPLYVVGVCAGVFGTLLAINLLGRARLVVRGLRLARFARDTRSRLDRRRQVVADRWHGHPCLAIGLDPSVSNLVEGIRRGRRFASLDCRYFIPSDGRTWLGFDASGLAGPRYFSAVVVECDVARDARTAPARRGLKPWRAEIGAKSSVLWCDRLVGPAGIDSAVDRLNAVLDEIDDARRPAA